MAVLRVLLPESLPAAELSLAWAHLTADGKLIAQGNSPLSAMPHAARCEAIAPAAAVLLTTVKLPVQQGEKARRLLPFAIEEQLAVDADSVHLALGAALPDGHVAVAAVDKVWLQTWTAFFEQHTRPLHHLYAETLLPNLSAGTWSVVWQQNSGWVRTGLNSGWALASESAAALQLADAPDIVLYADAIPAWLQALPLKITLKTRWKWTDWQPNTPDLLQGSFSRRAFQWQGWQKFRMAAGLAAAGLLLHILGTGWEVWHLQREQKTLQSNMEATFRQAFPEATVVVDPVLQMERQRANLRRAAGMADPHDFLALLQQITPLLPQNATQKIRYDNQTLRIELNLPNAASVDSLRHQLKQSRVKTELTVEGQIAHLKVWQP